MAYICIHLLFKIILFIIKYFNIKLNKKKDFESDIIYVFDIVKMYSI